MICSSGYALTQITRFLDLGKPSKEHLALQMELRRLQSARQVDEEESENQKQVLQAQLQSEVSDFTGVGETCLAFSHVISFHREEFLIRNDESAFILKPGFLVTYPDLYKLFSAGGAMCSAQGSAKRMWREVTLDE